MKRILSLFLAALMVLSLAACGAEPAAPEALKVQLLHTGVGAKARNRQFQRSHGRSSQMDSISSCANARCSPLIGWLFCAS